MLYVEEGAGEGELEKGGGVDPGVNGEGDGIVSGDSGSPTDSLVEGIDGRASMWPCSDGRSEAHPVHCLFRLAARLVSMTSCHLGRGSSGPRSSTMPTSSSKVTTTLGPGEGGDEALTEDASSVR